MKVAILSESSADEAAIRILVDGLLGLSTSPVALAPLRSRGWPSVLHVLNAIVKQCHYHTDADALVVVADSDDSPVHEPEHSETETACRHCLLHRELQRIQRELKPVTGRQPLRVAIGTAVPAIEAWFVAPDDVHVTELSWKRALSTKEWPYTRRELKTRVYGADRVSLAQETAAMCDSARKIIADFALLERRFPATFGHFAGTIRAWRAVSP